MQNGADSLTDVCCGRIVFKDDYDFGDRDDSLEAKELLKKYQKIQNREFEYKY